MRQRLPKTLIVGLATLAGVSLTAGLILENYFLEFMQTHPYLVNLISGMTSFPFGILIVAIGFNWFHEAERFHRTRVELLAPLVRIDDRAEDLARLLPLSWIDFTISDPPDDDDMDAVVARYQTNLGAGALLLVRCMRSYNGSLQRGEIPDDERRAMLDAASHLLAALKLAYESFQLEDLRRMRELLEAADLSLYIANAVPRTRGSATGSPFLAVKALSDLAEVTRLVFDHRSVRRFVKIHRPRSATVAGRPFRKRRVPVGHHY